MMLLIPAPITCLGLVCSVCLTWCSVFSWPAYIILIWCTISCSCVGAEMLWWTAPSGTNTNTGFPSLGYLGGCNVLAWLIPSNTIYGMLKSNCWVMPSIPAIWRYSIILSTDGCYRFHIIIWFDSRSSLWIHTHLSGQSTSLHHCDSAAWTLSKFHISNVVFDWD